MRRGCDWLERITTCRSLIGVACTAVRCLVTAALRWKRENGENCVCCYIGWMDEWMPNGFHVLPKAQRAESVEKLVNCVEATSLRCNGT